MMQRLFQFPRTQIRSGAHGELEGKFVVGYSGNLGRAHEYETLLAAAEILRGDERIVFVVIGGGKQFDALVENVRAQKLEANFRFFSYQDRAELKYSLSAADVHWLALRTELEGLIFPSKLYGIAAAGRAIIAITRPDGEIADIIRKYECGFVVAPGDAASLSSAILFLAGSTAACSEMGRRARAMLEANFGKTHGLSRWLRLIENIQASRPY